MIKCEDRVTHDGWHFAQCGKPAKYFIVPKVGAAAFTPKPVCGIHKPKGNRASIWNITTLGQGGCSVTLDEAMQKAAGHLPCGWIVSVCCERGAGWVELSNPDGDHINFDTSPDKNLAEQIDDAIAHAISE